MTVKDELLAAFCQAPAKPTVKDFEKLIEAIYTRVDGKDGRNGKDGYVTKKRYDDVLKRLESLEKAIAERGTIE